MQINNQFINSIKYEALGVIIWASSYFVRTTRQEFENRRIAKIDWRPEREARFCWIKKNLDQRFFLEFRE